VRHDGTIDRILQRVIPGAPVQRSVLDGLLRDKPKPETLVALLAAADPATVRAAVLYLGLYGTVCESAVLALCLHHDDASVVQLAEHCLWSIWMQSGSEEGNRHLAAAIGCIKAGDYAAASEVLDALVAREPSFAEAHFQRGLALAAAEQTAEAEDAYRRALRLNPYHFGAAAALGHASVERGHLQAALHFYRQALRIHPQLEDVPDAVHELENAIGTRRRNGN
jgi:tetratricopeptide (TPR) repeat protein